MVVHVDIHIPPQTFLKERALYVVAERRSEGDDSQEDGVSKGTGAGQCQRCRIRGRIAGVV